MNFAVVISVQQEVCVLCLFKIIQTNQLLARAYIEDIIRLRENMDFMFEWQEQYPTNERTEHVRDCFCHENIKSISMSCRVMFLLLYGHFECG